MYHNLFLFLGVKRTLYHTGDPIVVYTHLAYTVLVASKMAHFHRCIFCKASKTSLQLNGHHKSKQKCDLLCSVLHATEK